jgi:hypothetical protein
LGVDLRIDAKLTCALKRLYYMREMC